MTDYLTRQQEQRYFGGCCEHTAQVFSFCAAFLGILYAMERVKYFDGHSYFIIVIREMRSPNLPFFFLGDISLEFARHAMCKDIWCCLLPFLRSTPFYPPIRSMPDTAAPPPDIYPRGMNPRLRYIKPYWWPYKTFVKQRYAPALSTPTSLLTLIYKDGSDASSSKSSPQSSEIAPWSTM